MRILVAVLIAVGCVILGSLGGCFVSLVVEEPPLVPPWEPGGSIRAISFGICVALGLFFGVCAALRYLRRPR